MEEFIGESHVDITKLIALKDVLYSNSMVEGSFRMMKTYYLKPNIASENFPEELHKAIWDMNCRRPHHAHLIYTPEEVHQNPELKFVKPILQRINLERIEENRKHSCENNCQ